MPLDFIGFPGIFLQFMYEVRVHPKLFIVEYNARFIPPIKWSIALDDGHVWDGTDYAGASLQSFVDLFPDFIHKTLQSQ